MKRILYILTLFTLLGTVACAQTNDRSRSYVIGFYNLENLFDTYHDEGKVDWEYLPDGKNNWTEAKYHKKLKNMASVIKAMAEENKRYHTILGVSEVENRHVLEDLVSEPAIADANFQIIHYEGPDARGIDCALLYRPENFTPIESKSIPYNFEGESNVTFKEDSASLSRFRTRDILMVRGMLGEEMFAIFVTHLPSRGATSPYRERGAEIIYHNAMELQKQYPDIKIVVMGDMNDDPSDVSMVEYLHSKATIEETQESDFFSPFIVMHKAGYGSLAYQGAWNLFDNILVNSNLAHAPEGTLTIKPIVKKKYYGRVFKKPFMINQEGQYKGTPFRTSSGGAFIGGYSDHLPTYIIVSNK